ncbi:allantoate amidohydrolase [Dietzia cinnamea]|uniref:N-carbamoyl-L-amino-acid hydrolase n=1 Tax=Dietzia cinnamea TaxID=321318 RepID=A0A4R3ZMT6_9ACTN|nr:allantoate amidohydrolase [Dietzia cinnamea]TCW21131.1 N-carbamoyl-L-amino-acid hydrolase [Dietzia cinnamea]
MSAPVAATVTSLMSAIADVGTDPIRGGYSRPVYSTAESSLREWFLSEAAARGLCAETDRNGIIWAWWNPADHPLEDAVVTGSHLDSVPGGGAFDGPLGVASALVAVDRLVARGVRPRRALALTVFPEEEGSRFGRACLGSLLLTGAMDPAVAAGLSDDDGVTFAELCRSNGLEPAHLGRDDEALGRIGRFVELHVEQGRGLVDLDSPVAVASSIIGHGRWRLTFTGQGNHAGTTLLADRRDPMIPAARTVLDVRRIAHVHRGARATVGRLVPTPGGTNVIASRVDLWLDVRHPDDVVTERIVYEISEAAASAALREGCGVSMVEESLSASVDFDPVLRDRLRAGLPGVPVLPTGAGHDAGVLAAHVPTAMLFVRNPSGVSHSPDEYVEDADAECGAEALADVLADLLTTDTLGTDTLTTEAKE